MGKLDPELCSHFLQQSPTPSSAYPEPTSPREDWSGSRPRSGLSLLTTGASWALKQVEGQGADKRKEDQ